MSDGTTVVRVEAFALRYPEPHLWGEERCTTLVRIEDADGAVGWGECVVKAPEAALAAKLLIDRALGGFVVGRRPSERAKTWDALKVHMGWYGNGGIGELALSGLDIALWDLLGRRTGLPLAELLGGKVHDSVPVSAATILDDRDFDALAKECQDCVDRGFRMIKGGFGFKGSAFGVNLAADVAAVAAAREAVGPDVELAVDAALFGAWSPQHSIRFLDRCESLDLAWLEDFLLTEDIAGYGQVRDATRTPIATGEREWNFAGYRRLVDPPVVDIVLVDPGRTAGVTGMKQIVDFAATQGVQFVPHSWSTAIVTAACLQIYAASRNGRVFELMPKPTPLQNDLVGAAFAVEDGRVAVPDLPGLGIEVDLDIVKRYEFGT